MKSDELYCIANLCEICSAKIYAMLLNPLFPFAFVCEYFQYRNADSASLTVIVKNLNKG